MDRDGSMRSLWQDTTAKEITSSPFPEKKMFDVAIVGAGVTGITTAHALQDAGLSVMIAEAKNISFGTSSGTTAHLNTFMDTPYSVVQQKFGKPDAKLLAQSILGAFGHIRKNVERYGIDCGYRELPAYLFSQDDKQTKELTSIFESMNECGIPCSWVARSPMPIPYEKVLEIPGQATFHPTRYLYRLAEEFQKTGGTLIQDCRVTDVETGSAPHLVTTTRGTIEARHVIYATHVPPGVNLLHFRCAPYRSYVLAMKLDSQQSLPDVLAYDMYDPYHYYRSQEIDGTTYFIVGGEDHKTGHEENTQQRFRNLEAHVRKHFQVAEITESWSSQYFEPADGLPYIGQLPGNPESMYVATGYGGNGMIYSSVAALLLRDMIMGKPNEAIELFDPNRISMVAGFSNFVKESADVVGNLLARIFVNGKKLEELSALAPGEAALVNYEGKKIAIYKDENGKVFPLSAACTHVKCDVAWNNAEKTWDCPCHGSRFSFTGEMLTGPARKDLHPVDINDK